MTKTKNGNSQAASTGITIPQLNVPGKKQLITLDKLVIEKSNTDTSRQYLFWKAQFNNYANYTGATDEEKLGILVNKIEVSVYDYI